MSREIAAYSSVALIESPDNYVVHHRPNLRAGTLAYAGRYQFLGGHRDRIEGELEAPDVTIVREISEETNLGRLPIDSFTEYWQGLFEGTGKHGEPIVRHVTCFHLGLSALQASGMEVKKLEGGELVYVKKTIEAVEELADRLTPFAYTMLAAHVRGRKPELQIERI
ncbi:MAG TPA: hypothetical protein VFT59_00015 [Candidatus Saccharimonadales bacterium]|nr:hypothetical protein [Candidatus Saccharimonadales bacterium]